MDSNGTIELQFCCFPSEQVLSLHIGFMRGWQQWGHPARNSCGCNPSVDRIPSERNCHDAATPIDPLHLRSRCRNCPGDTGAFSCLTQKTKGVLLQKSSHGTDYDGQTHQPAPVFQISNDQKTELLLKRTQSPGLVSLPPQHVQLVFPMDSFPMFDAKG